LFIVEIKGLPLGRRNDWRVKTEAPAWTDRCGIFHCALDAGENKLTGRAALARRGFVQPAMELSRQVDGSPYRFRFHNSIIRRRLK
jgi:hypothetical protein